MVVVSEVNSAIWGTDFESLDYGLFNTPEWVGSLSSNSFPALYLNFGVNGQVVGKIAGLVLKGGKIKGNQLFFCSGPALKQWDPKLFASCLEALRIYAKKNNYSRIHIRPFDQHLKEVVHHKNFFHTVTAEYVVDYRKNNNKVRMSYGFKQNVKKARNAGVCFNKTRSLDVLHRMLELMDTTRESRVRKYGQFYDPMFLVNLNEKTLSALLESGIGVLCYGELDGVIRSVQINIERNGQIYGLLMGSDGVAYQYGIPSFIDYNITMNAIESGCKYYNLGLIPPEEQGGGGIRKYKESQGGEKMVSYGYYSYFLVFPLVLINPLLKLSKKLPSNTFLNSIRKISKLFSA